MWFSKVRSIFLDKEKYGEKWIQEFLKHTNINLYFILIKSKTFKPQHQKPQSQLSFRRLPRITRASQPLNLKSFALLHDQHKKRMEAAEQKCSRPQNNLLEKGCKKATLIAIFISLCVQGKILYNFKA